MDEASMRTILRAMVDQPQRWRERSVERLEPLSEDHCRRRISFQFCLNSEFLEGGREALGDDLLRELEANGWRQTIPLMRVPKGTIMEFSCRDAMGAAVAIKNHFDGSRHTSDYLMAHFEEVLDEVGVPSLPAEVLAAMDAYFYLVASVSYESQRDFATSTLKGTPTATADPLEAARALVSVVGGKSMRPFVEQDGEVAEATVRAVATYLQRLREQAKSLEAAGVANLVAHCWSDAVLNPLWMAKGHARWRYRLGEPFKDADAAVLAMLSIARRVLSIHTLAWQTRLANEHAKWTAWSGLFRETYLFAFAWIVYADFDVRMNRPLLVKVESLERVENSGSSFALSYQQRFPVGPKDFLSKHIELAAAEPEIHLTPPEVFDPKSGKWVKASQSALREGAEAKPHLYHYIASDPVSHFEPKAIEDWHEEFGSGDLMEGNRRLKLRTKIRVAPEIRGAYWIVAVAMWVLAWIAVASALPVLWAEADCFRNLETLSLTTGGFIAVLILFAGARHKKMLVASLVRAETALVLSASGLIVLALIGSLFVIAARRLAGSGCA